MNLNMFDSYQDSSYKQKINVLEHKLKELQDLLISKCNFAGEKDLWCHVEKLKEFTS